MREQLAKTILEEGLLDEKRIQECFRLEDETGQTLDKILMKKGYLSEEDTLRVFSNILGIPYVPELSLDSVPLEFVDKVPVQFARNYTLIAIGQENGNFQIATCSPFEVYPMDDLATMTGREVDPVLAPQSEITNLINQAYKRKTEAVDEALDVLEEEDILGITKEIEESEDLLDMAAKAPIIKLVNMLMFQALKMRSSDIHIQPYEDRLQVRYRIDGVLYDMESVPKKFQEAIISRVKVMGKMDIAERRLPQDGRASIRLGNSEVDIRLSSVPTSNGERIVMRLLDKSARLYELEELGLDERNLDLLNRFIHFSHGIIFVTGPTGSGKTTTLYAAMNRINSKDRNIITIEDPIEYHLSGVSQIQVSVKKGLTFASGLRSILRQDPDVLMVGEVRDEETARIAIQSALTGHLVFSTLHTNDAPGAITRMLDIGIEPYLVASSLIAVIAQRLVRVICYHCKESYVPDETELLKVRELGINPDDLPNGRLSRGRGCEFCFDTGFSDRTGIYEFLPIDDLVKGQIMDRVGSNTIKRSAFERGFKTLRMDGVRKILAGITTADEVLKRTQMDIL